MKKTEIFPLEVNNIAELSIAIKSITEKIQRTTSELSEKITAGTNNPLPPEIKDLIRSRNRARQAMKTPS